MARKVTFSKIASLSVLAGCALAGGTATAQPMEVVTVEAASEIVIGRSPSGAPIKEIKIKSTVSYADLDLTTDAGAKELEKRIRETATSTCNQIRLDLEAPGSTVEKCIRDAVAGGMAQANEAIAAKRAAAKK